MTTQSPQTPPPLPDAGDSRLDSFLLKAAPIIAAERGINAKSRVMLEALARDSKLPDELFDQAIHMLQGAPPVANKKRNRWYRAFEKYLKHQLNDVPRGIITARIESRAIQKGIAKFQLTEQQAREALHEVAAELGIRRISQSEAERHVAAIVERKVGDVEWLDDATTQLLYDAGRKWGLSTEQVDAVIHRLLDENRRRQEREHRTAVVAIASACALILVIVTSLVGLMLVKNLREPAAAATAQKVRVDASEDEPRYDEQPAIKSFDPPKWWSEALTMASVKARINQPDFAKIYEQLVSPEPFTRSTAYSQLGEFCRETLKSSRAIAQLMIDQVFVESYVLEPSDEAAASVRDSLLQFIAADAKDLPSDAQAYDRGFWAVRAAVATLQHDELPEPRANRLELALGRAIGTAVRGDGNSQALRQRCLAALAEVYYNRLTAAARTQPNLTSDLHQELSRFVAQFAGDDPALLNRLNSAFLGELLKAEDSVWMRYQQNGLIDACLHSADPVNVLKFVEALEETEDRALQLYLAEMFIRTLGAIPKSADPQDVAAAVRERLGITVRSTAKSSRDRWRILRESVDRFRREREEELSAVSRDSSAWQLHRQRLFNAVDLSHLATLACALAQQETGVPEFDQLDEEGPPNVFDDRDPKAPPTDRWNLPTGGAIGGLTIEQRRLTQLREYVESLAQREEKLLPVIRKSIYRGLAKLAPQVRRIEPARARTIAVYMLAPKSADEQAVVLEKAQDVGRWKQVRLALADEVRQTSVSQQNVELLLSEILGGGVSLEPEKWRLDAARRLLRSVRDDLSTETAIARSRTPDMIYDAAARALLTRYKSRARLLGIASADYESKDSPAKLQQVVIAHTSDKIRGNATSASDQKLLEQLPHRLRAIEYIGNNDLRETVLLQRIWIQLVAIQLKYQRPDRSANVRDLVDQLQQRDAMATDLLAQLEDGEAATLDLWMLYGP